MIIIADGAALVAEIHVAPGDLVPNGGVLITTELMKMRRDIRAEAPARVEAVHVAVGDELAEGAPIVTLSASDEPAEAAPVMDTPRTERDAFLARLAQTRDAARPEAVAKRHAQGYRTARENLADLFDGEMLEYGALAVAAQRRQRPLADLHERTPGDGIVTGIGEVSGARVAAMAVDYTVLAGTQRFNHHRKMDRLLEVAAAEHLPVVLFAEGGGGRPNDGDVEDIMAAWLNVGSFAAFAAHPAPTIAIAAGYCFAGNAALFGAADLRIAAEASWIGMGGPAMIEGGGLGRVHPKEIGPADMQAKTGGADLVVADEAAAVAAARTLLTLDAPHAAQPGDPETLRTAAPADPGEAYDMRRLIAALVDGGEMLELRRAYAPGLITGVARIDGRAVGLMANNPLHLGGAIDAGAGRKGAWFIGLCNDWDLPLVTLCDTPGFMVGVAAEEAGQVDASTQLFRAGARFTGPLATVIIRKAYGLGAMAMAGGGFARPHYCCAWPTGEVGAMGLDGAVRLGHRDHLAAIADETAREAEVTRLIGELRTRGSALNAASLLEFDAVIDPAETRAVLAAALRSPRPV